MDVRIVGDNGFKIDRTVFQEGRGGKLPNLGVFFNITGNGNVDESADIGLDGSAVLIDSDAIVGGVKNHGIVATSGGIVGSDDGDHENFSFLGFEGETAGRDLNPAGTGPAVALVIDAFDLNGGAFIIGNNEILGGAGDYPGSIGIVADFNLLGDNFTGFNSDLKTGRDGG